MPWQRVFVLCCVKFTSKLSWKIRVLAFAWNTFASLQLHLCRNSRDSLEQWTLVDEFMGIRVFLTSGAHSSELICKKELNLFLIFYSYQKANLDEKRQFRLYLSAVVSTCLFFIVFYFFNIFNIAMFGGFLLMALVNVALLLHTSLKVYRLSESTRLSDHAWFETEKERHSNLQNFPRKRLLLPLCE